MSFARDDAGAASPGSALGNEHIAHLLKASGWARFIAIASVIGTGLMALAFGAFTVQALRVPAARGIRVCLVLIVTPASFVARAALLWGYARGVVSFVRRGDPTPAQAFRHLRRFFQLWTIVVAFGIAMTILSVLGVR